MNNNNYKVGTVLTCTVSKSCGYKKGDNYIVIEKDGVKGLEASDGLFDPIKELISGFVVADATTQAIRQLTLVRDNDRQMGI